MLVPMATTVLTPASALGMFLSIVIGVGVCMLTLKGQYIGIHPMKRLYARGLYVARDACSWCACISGHT